MKNILFIIFIATCLYACKPEYKANELNQIPVLAWYSIPYDQTSLRRYQELKDAGFTHNLSFFPDTKTMHAAFDTAALAGIKMVAYCPELKTKTEETVKLFKNHPALAAYMLRDEPNRKDFPELGDWARKIIAIDNEHFCYLNLFPNYASEEQLGTITYKEHVDLFVDEVPIQILSFDHYPVVGDSLRANWYDNLEIFSEAAKKAGKPFWAFALSVAHGPYPVPTIAQLRLQVFSDLAYGARGIQYFTYWTPYDTVWKFNNAPISFEGKRTDSYDRVKQMNSEIKNLSYIFLGAKVISVTHTGDPIPVGTKPLVTLPKQVTELKTEGSGAVVSHLENNGSSYLAIVNRDFLKSMKLIINCDKGVYKINKDGSKVNADAYQRSLEIDPGDIAIFTWNE